MRDKIKLYITRANEKKRINGYCACILAIILIFTFFLPVFCTFLQGEKESILGYYSFNLINDTFDIIHYAISLLIISIILTFIILLTGIITIFTNDKSLKKAKISSLIVMAIKSITDIAIIVLISQTKTNIQMDWGGFFLPIIDIMFLGLLIYIYINNKDSSDKIFVKNNTEK